MPRLSQDNQRLDTAAMPTLSLPDGAARSFDAPVTGADFAASIGPGLAKAALLVEVDGELR
ncbi:MAG: hypothetical protein OXC15_12180, partial [Rhodospirillaceae bacterium]|nr:hypothetical protein [Rhodospirillaceae bacterium]